MVHTRTLQLQEDALAVKLSPNGKLIAVSLMDSTIKVSKSKEFKNYKYFFKTGGLNSAW